MTEQDLTDSVGGMSQDVDILRELLLELEKSQRSPPEAFFVYPDEVADVLGRDRAEVEKALELLEQLEFIEGPGAYDNGWLFRKLTRRGAALADSIRDTREWRRVKDAYAPMVAG